MTKLITRKPKRLFTFGCSFTKWRWPSWPEIIAYDLNVPFYNYGKGGAGNQYIHNAIMQADTVHKFNRNDLVIVSWTNVCRDDRYAWGLWHTPGNIFSQSQYDMRFIKKWADPIGYTIRDFATIKSTWEFLDKRKCQFHFLKMIDFSLFDQWSHEKINCNVVNVNEFYEPYISKIHKSFYEVLWNNDFRIRFKKDEAVHPKFGDGHPDTEESYTYLKTVFDQHKFSEKTSKAVNESFITTNNIIKTHLIENNNLAGLLFNESRFVMSEPTFTFETRE